MKTHSTGCQTNRLYNRFDNRLYRVNRVLEFHVWLWCITGLYVLHRHISLCVFYVVFVVGLRFPSFPDQNKANWRKNRVPYAFQPVFCRTWKIGKLSFWSCLQETRQKWCEGTNLIRVTAVKFESMMIGRRPGVKLVQTPSTFPTWCVLEGPKGNTESLLAAIFWVHLG